jgi:hypothetical protein
MRSRKKRQLTKAELRALGATPGLMAHRVGPDGRAEVRQLTADARSPRGEQLFDERQRGNLAPPFGPGLTNNNEATMDTNTSEGER